MLPFDTKILQVIKGSRTTTLETALWEREGRIVGVMWWSEPVFVV
jgi:hypothetical protein